MIFTAQQARDNSSLKATLDKIYEKIKIVSKDKNDLTIVFGENSDFEYCDAFRNEEDIKENLEKAGYEVRWDYTTPLGIPTLYIDWRFPN